MTKPYGKIYKNNTNVSITPFDIKDIWPVGSIYLSVNTINPSTYFGGTWELVGGSNYLIGYQSNNDWFNRPGCSQGSGSGPGAWNTNDTTLTTNQIPAHSHTGSSGTAGYHSHEVFLNGDPNFPAIGYPGWSGGKKGQAYSIQGTYTGFGTYTNGTGDHTHSISIGNSGGGKGHNHFHVSPYYIVCVWKRIA